MPSPRRAPGTRRSSPAPTPIAPGSSPTNGAIPRPASWRIAPRIPRRRTSATRPRGATGTSPKNLMVESLETCLKRLDARSKRYRGLGQGPRRDPARGQGGDGSSTRPRPASSASTTYYMKEHPKWVGRLQREEDGGRVLPPGMEAASSPRRPIRDPFPTSGPGSPRAGSCRRRWARGRRRPGLFLRRDPCEPFGDELTLAPARAAIEGEQLGRDDAPTSSSWASRATTTSTTRTGGVSHLAGPHALPRSRAAGFPNDLDVSLGRDNYLAVLTADHGFMPAPEFSQSLGRDAGRVNSPRRCSRGSTRVSAKKFGEGRWAPAMSAQGVLLNRPLAAQKAVPVPQFYEEARRLLLRGALRRSGVHARRAGERQPRRRSRIRGDAKRMAPRALGRPAGRAEAVLMYDSGTTRNHAWLPSSL